MNTDTLSALKTVHCKEQPVFEHLGYDYGNFPESEKASREVLSLPMHPFIKDLEFKKVSDTIIKLIN